MCVNSGMLQIEHIYRFLAKNLFEDFCFAYLPNGTPTIKESLTIKDLYILNEETWRIHGMLFYDQEPVTVGITDQYLKLFTDPDTSMILVTSERSKISQTLAKYHLYYFFHGFAALDWFRGFYVLNYTKNSVRHYRYDYQSFNRIITGDREYRKTFVDQLRKNNLLEHGSVSYGVTEDPISEERLIIDHEQVSASASADIPDVDAFWHVVTETVFYYDKLHLTEKIFKPIVSKQPFMLLAAPGNLEYLRSYGFKTFAGIIDESYDTIKDNDARIEAVVAQLKWYCSLTVSEKTEIQKQCEPIVEHNFYHFYGKFKEIITDELLDNSKKMFLEVGHDDSDVDYATVRKLLIS